ncbi:hypothetical protein F4779DRAFT_14461 [Xylariaceae sp. FL0662B]|nr:hypothetical protein F4779DRAFT_14461 [Xylariaceae sp. FL0662B]
MAPNPDIISALPTVGFEYIEGRTPFSFDLDRTALQDALRAVTATLDGAAVDAAIAELFTAALKLWTPKHAMHENRLWDAVRNEVVWTREVPGRAVAELAVTLLQARRLYITFSRFRKRPEPAAAGPAGEGQKGQEGHTAREIDRYLGESPWSEPDARYKDWEPWLLAAMMDKMKKGMKAPWSSFNG